MDQGSGLEEFYYHQNSVFSVAALNASGVMVERYSYTSIYGVHQVTDGGGGARAPPDEVGNPWRFQGRRRDSETGWFYFRQRCLDPVDARRRTWVRPTGTHRLVPEQGRKEGGRGPTVDRW